MEELNGATGAADSGVVETTAGTPPASTTGTTAAPDEQTAGPANAAADQGQSTTPQDDDFADVPSLDELKTLAEKNTPYAKSLIQLRSAIEEKYRPQLNEFTEKFKVVEPVIDRFQTPEEVQRIVGLHDKLNAYVRDPDTGKLVPDTEGYVQDIAESDPERADYIAADFMNGLTRTDDGREITRFELALEEIGRNPELKDRRAAALKLLGGVEPSSIAPTWQPTAEELEVVRPELQEIYKQLPYDERESLKLNDPDFINRYLAKEKFQADLMRENETAKELQARQQEQREQYFRQQAEQAGHKAVEDGFRQLFTEYRNNVVENSKFIAPIDPQSPEAQQMGPEAVAQLNQKVQSVNAGVGNIIALTTAALSVPDTAWLAQEVLKGFGVTDEMLQKFNAARMEYANNTRDAGELGFEAQQGRNGNGSAGLGTLQSNARRAASNLKANGNAISKAVKAVLSDFFEMKAGNYNSTLNGAATARPPVNGQGFNPTTAPAQRPPGGTFTRREIEQMFG